MRVIFMGTPEFSVPALHWLAENHDVVSVFTQPDRQGGRGKKWLPPPVKTAAESLGIPVLQPDRIKTDENVRQIRALSPDIIIVIAYGQIISRDILDLPRYGCLNVHASLLPCLRGASPINMAIVRGLTETGVTIMQMDEGLDTGAMLWRRKVSIGEEMTAGELHDLLMQEGVEALKETFARIDELEAVPQDDDRSSYAPIIKREMAQIDWSQSARSIHDLVRGFNPWPVAYTVYRGERIKIYRTQRIEGADTQQAPGTIIEKTKEGLIVQTGDGLLHLLEVQGPGSRRMATADYLRGHDMPEGTVLE